MRSANQLNPILDEALGELDECSNSAQAEEVEEDEAPPVTALKEGGTVESH